MNEERKTSLAQALLGGERGQLRVGPMVERWMGIWCVLAASYLALHRVVPASDEGGFFWSDDPAQWLDWLFWSTSGVFLYLLSALAARVTDPSRVDIAFPTTGRGYFIEVLKGLVAAFVVLWVAVNVVDVDWLGLEIRLKEAPGLTAAFAFVLGFYAKVTRKLFFQVVVQFARRTLERLLHRAVGDETDDRAYVELHVDPRLQRPYLLAASTEKGRPGHEASRARRVRYKESGIVSRAGFTVNAFLKTVFIANDLFTSPNEDCIVEMVAHEASHVCQGWWSDSLQQEVKAYKTGVAVMETLKERGDACEGDTDGWLRLDDRRAEDRVRAMKSTVPLYGIIPCRQQEGWNDKKAFVRQALFLGLDTLGLSRWCVGGEPEEGGDG